LGPTVKEFFESTRGFHGEKLIEYWKKLSSKWSVSEKIRFAIELAEQNVWYWDTIFDDILCSEEPKDGYPLLAIMVEKGSIGIKLDRFRIRCQKDRSFSRKYVNLLDQAGTRNTATFSGLLLALSFQRTQEDWSEIESRLSSVDEQEQLSAAFAIRVLDNNKQTTDIPESFSDKIFDCIKNGNYEVKRQLVWFFISHFNPADKRVSDCLDAIFHDVGTLGNTLDALSIESPVPRDTRFQILEKAGIIQDTCIEDKIGNCLVAWGREDVTKSLEIIKNISIKNHHQTPGALKWAAEEIGKKFVERSLDVVESWLTEDVPEGEKMLREHFLYPDFLIFLTERDRDKLVQRLSKLSQQEGNDDLVIATIQEYMKTVNRKKDWNPVNSQDDMRLQSCIECLKTIALRKGKDASKFPSGAKPKIFQCGGLIELIEEVEHKPDSKLLRTALDDYPNIKRFVTVSVDKELKSPPPIPFFILLGSDRCNYIGYLKRVDQAEVTLNGGKLEVEKLRAYDTLRRQGLLNHLNNCLARIDEMESGTGELRKKLFHEDEEQFRSALSEIEVIGRLRSQLRVGISELSEVVMEDGTRIPKRPDISVQFGDYSIRIEVITPEMAAILRYLGGGGIPNRLTGKIISEFNRHFRGQADDKDVIIIVDTSRTEIDYWDAISSMRGTPSIQMFFDKDSGKVAAERPVYAKDSVSAKEPETRSILGVLLFKEKMSKEGHLLLIGKFFPNIYSRAPDKLIFCKVIEEQLLDVVEASF